MVLEITTLQPMILRSLLTARTDFDTNAETSGYGVCCESCCSGVGGLG